MNLIKDRDARTKSRKKAKDKFDKNITLSLVPMDNKKCTLSLERSEGDARLLDEGAIVTASGDIDLYIKKGAIRKYVSGKNTKLTPRSIFGDIAESYFKSPDEPMNIDEKYEGTINIGHQPFATFPVGIVGTWKQSDLKMVNNGDGRKGLDVDLKLNPLHPLVQALEVQGIPVGVSVEMYLHIDDKATDTLAEEKNIYAPVVDEIFISDFAIVGECGNVGSSDSVILQGVEMEDEKKVTEEVAEEVAEVTEEMTEESTEVDTEEEETETESTEVDIEEEDTAEDDAEEDIEEESVDEAEADDGESEEDADEEDNSEQVLEALDSMQNEINTLKEKIESLKKTNRKLNKKLEAKAEADEKFMQKFKGLEVSLGEKKEEKKEAAWKLYESGDGRGVL